MLTTLDYMKIFHETKNSVTLINSSLQLIEKRHPDVAAYPLWKDTMQEVTYLKNLIAELSLSRTGYPLNLSLVAPADFIREISDAIHNLSFSQNFVCKTTLEENLPPIFIDSLRLKQALINLLKNSYEAMGETGTVILNVFRKDDFIDIELTDFGGGIPDTTKDNLFEIFTTSKEYGTGLGLPIARQIIEDHSGRLLFESRPGDGCTFSILLPVNPGS